MAENPIKTASRFKPGGTGQVITNHLVGRVANVSKDKLGRWVSTTFHGNLNPVTVFTIYAPSASIPTTAKATNTLQQRIFYEQQALKNNNITEFQAINNQTPRIKFEQDLIQAVQQVIQKQHDVIVMGDFNDTMNGSNSLPQLLMRKCQLVDIWEKENPESEEFATYYRGTQRIDHCLATFNVATAIENIQYTDFFTISNSDHSGIILDINTDKLFPKRSKIQTHLERGILSNDYKQLPKYITKVYDHLESNNVFQQMEALKTAPLLEAEKIEKVDQLISQACISAEKSIKKRRRPWWSLELHTTRYTLSVVHKAINQARKGRYEQDRLQLLLDQRQCNTELPHEISKLYALRKKLKSDLQEITQQSREKREEYLQQHANTKSTEDESKKAHITNAILHTEKLNRAFKTMSSIRKPVQKNGISLIKIPASWGPPDEAIAHPEQLEDPAKATDWKDITDMKSIQKYMLARNRKHFHQAYGTPLTLPPWPDMLDWAGSTSTAREILEGRFETDDLSNIHATIIRQCQHEFDSPLVHRQLTPADMIGKLKKWKETTSTSPSGRHLGHYRAMVQSLQFLPDDDQREQLQQYQKEIIMLYTDVINYATRFGYILQRWRIIESTMIPKDAGNAKIHRLRVIHIFEADYNLLLGVKWRELIWQLENKGGLHPGQHGSRPGHQATDLTLLEELTFDVSKCSRTTIGNFDNDASACYDRVVAEFASLASLSHGHHPSLIKANTQALKQSKYYIRNTTNEKEAYYQHSDTYPIYGTGQGCSNSPTVWCLVSSTLFKAHQQASHGASFCSPDKSINTHFSMVGFVDDSTGRVNQFTARPQPSVQTITDMMSSDAQHWHDALDFSGGKLELPKCSYHLLSYQFKNNGTAITVENPDLPDLHVRNQHQSVPITRMSIYKAHKTLGHWKAPAGQGKTNLMKLSQKARTIASQINGSHLTRTFVWLMYLSIYVSAVKYTLPQNFYSHSELTEAQRQSMQLIIGTCGFSRNTPLVILYGPSHLGGAGFIHWYTLQGEGQVLNFIQHWRTQTDVGQMLRIAVFWAQHFAGTSDLILNDHQSHLHYVPAKWIMALRSFLSSINARLQIYQPLIYPKQRYQDQHLMDVAQSSAIFTNKQLEYINYCRLHMQVSTISDISNEQGTHLQSGAYHGPPDSLYSSPKWLYPVQVKPDHTAWTFWLRLLAIIATPSHKLRCPLGPWLFPATELARQWNEYRHVTGDHQYVQQLTDPTQWLQLNRNRKTWQPTCLTREIPTDNLFPCSKTTDLISSLKMIPPSKRISTPDTFQAFLHNQPLSVQHFLAHIDLKLDPYTIMDILRNAETNFLTTDGASLPLRTAYGWVLALDEHHILAEGSGPAAGAATSYRAEAYGLHAGVKFLTLLCQYTQQTFSQLTVLCDNKSLIHKADIRHQYTHPFPTSTTSSEWDQIESAHQLILSLNLDIDYYHVKGHQDDNGTELDSEAKLNIRADYLAGEYIYNNPQSHPTVPVDDVSQCHLQIGTRTITSNYRHELRDAACAPSLRKHILSLCAGSATLSMIDWNVFSTANQKLKHLRVWNTKFIYNLLPTVRYEKTFTYDRPRCDTCSDKVDTWLHHLSCPETHRRTITQRHLQDIRKHLSSINTSPDLQQIIMTGLRTFYLQQDPSFGRHFPLFCLQAAIGWHNFLKGIWHKQWCLSQDLYLKETHQYSVQSTGTLWATNVIVYLRTAVHRRWVEHTQAIHNPPTGIKATCQRLLSRIASLQSQYATCCPHFSHQFFIDTTSSHHTLTSLQNWINLHAPVIDQALTLQSHHSRQNQSLITTYFH